MTVTAGVRAPSPTAAGGRRREGEEGQQLGFGRLRPKGQRIDKPLVATRATEAAQLAAS